MLLKSCPNILSSPFDHEFNFRFVRVILTVTDSSSGSPILMAPIREGQKTLYKIECYRMVRVKGERP